MDKVDPLANSSDLQGKTVILVVDDDKVVRMSACARLKRAGYMSVSVGSVDEAVQMLKAHPHTFSAIISDIMLGKMDGFAFRDTARGLDSSMPFFFMTALDPEEGSGFLKRNASVADLSVWDNGTPEPSLAVAAGDSSTAFELINRQMGNHGRGRLMVRELCCGIERKRYGSLNETIYHVKLGEYKEKE